MLRIEEIQQRLKELEVRKKYLDKKRQAIYMQIWRYNKQIKLLEDAQQNTLFDNIVETIGDKSEYDN